MNPTIPLSLADEEAEARKKSVLLTMGPIVGANLMPSSLAGFLHESAPRHGFKVIHNRGFWEFWHEQSRKVLVLHEADTPDEKCIPCWVVKNLHTHRDEWRQRLLPDPNQ